VIFGSANRRRVREELTATLKQSLHMRRPLPQLTADAPCNGCEIASWILSVVAVFFVLHFHLLSAVIAGLLVYELVHVMFPFFARKLSDTRAKAVAVVLIILVVVGAITAVAVGLIVFVRSEGGSIAGLLAKMAEILDSSRASLPVSVAEYLPTGADGIRESVTSWLRDHSVDLQQLGRRTGLVLVHIIVGMAIGAMLAMREALDHNAGGPLTRALAERVQRMGEAFRRVVFAQVKISAINTAFTALYLAVVLPMLGIHLPLVKTMIAVTFVAGLLPVVGNLISNSIVFIVSLAHSPMVAVSSLVYLIVIHKLEYFLNARIVGGQIHARAWELLVAMLVMDAMFGIAGLIAAPIVYAWVKDELKCRKLI
jgi:predicted PurR-regulated permease PerM